MTAGVVVTGAGRGIGAAIAELAFFLGTPLSSYVTGVVVPIDGGWSAQGITS